MVNCPINGRLKRMLIVVLCDSVTVWVYQVVGKHKFVVEGSVKWKAHD